MDGDRQKVGIKFAATYLAQPEAIKDIFSQFGTVKRISREQVTKSVLWEDAETKALSGRDPTYPQVVVNIRDNLPVEVAVIGSFSPGEGDAYIRRSLELQEGHASFVDEYNEASAKIANTDFPNGDLTAVYTFSVGKKDLVFHRHEGHRAISSVTGSEGATLRFSGCTPEEAAKDPEKFVEKMFFIEVPPDSLFTLRFHGTVYHQFGPTSYGRDAFFAISVHTNEIGGLDGELLETVKAGGGSIPLLTEPIDNGVADLLENKELKHLNVPNGRTRRTVSETKRYILHTRQEGKNIERHIGNHTLPPTPITQEIASLLEQDDVMSRVPVFKLPRVGKPSVTEEEAIWVVEFKDEAAVGKALKAPSLDLAGRVLKVQSL